MNTKKIVLFTALALFVIAFVGANPLMFGLCQNIEVYNETIKRCVSGALLPEYISQLVGFLSLSVIVLSLITYRMKDEVFRAWWGFARWWMPVTIVVTLFLNNAGGGGWGLGSGGFDIFVLSILYAVLIVTSLVRIVRAYLKAR